MIKLPEKLNITTNFDTIITEINQLETNDKVEFSFEQVTFIAPESTMILIGLSKLAFDRTGKAVIWSRMKEYIRTYMERVGISNVDFIAMPRLFYKRKVNPSDSLMELVIINKPQDMPDILKRVEHILNTWFSDREASRYTKQILDFIREIAGNSLEHSEEHGKGICYFTLQKYGASSEDISVQLAFGDTGMGMKKSLEKKFPEVVCNNPIEHAFIQGKSCREEEDGGLGFRRVKMLLKEFGGKVMIRTGDSALTYIGERDFFKKKPFKQELPGTQTSFILK